LLNDLVAVDWGNETFSETDLNNFGSNMLVSITPPIIISHNVNGSVIGSRMILLVFV
jgi:hypothetical protein